MDQLSRFLFIAAIVAAMVGTGPYVAMIVATAVLNWWVILIVAAIIWAAEYAAKRWKGAVQ